MGEDLSYGIEGAPDEDDRWEQITDEDALLTRGADSLDEGYIPPDRWSPVEHYGSTLAEMRRGETIEMRLAQEEPDLDAADDDEADDDGLERQVGRQRAGRLVAPGEAFGEDDEAEALAYDVGISGGAATAEEAAMHVIDD